MKGSYPIYIKELHVSGFKRFFNLHVNFSSEINIIVGDNDAGRSTLLEAIDAVLNGQYRGVPLARSLSENLFNERTVSTYISKIRAGEKCFPPEIVIEVFFGGDDDSDGIIALYEGDDNSKKAAESGISLRIALDLDSFAEEYQAFVDTKECF